MIQNIFLSYRRADIPGYVGRLSDHLSRIFGQNVVFIDVDSIRIGDNFAECLKENLSQCCVFLSLIGPNWSGSQRNRKHARILDPEDWVRTEVKTALSLNCPIIPVVVEGAEMPAESDLPVDIRTLSSLKYVELRHHSFNEDASKIVSAIQSKAPHLLTLREQNIDRFSRDGNPNIKLIRSEIRRKIRSLQDGMK